MADALREQIRLRLETQNQLIVVAVAVAGAAASFGAQRLDHSPDVLALLAFLFAALTAAMLRQEYQVVAVNGHLLDAEAFGSHAVQQAYWARYARRNLRPSGPFGTLIQCVQAAGFFAIPVIAMVAFTWAAIAAEPGGVGWLLISVTLLTFGLDSVAGAYLYKKYRDLDRDADAPLSATRRLPTS